MIAYKGFNQDMTCTMGKGTFQYEVGKTYTEDEAKCANTGFHCVEEPIEVLKWYPNGRYCIVEAAGDINEDGEERIACTQITILREVSLVELAILECKWLQKHSGRKYSSKVCRDEGSAEAGRIVVVRGKHPKASGGLDSTIFLVKEEKKSKEIAEIGVYQIDGKEHKPGIYYRADGRRCAR